MPRCRVESLLSGRSCLPFAASGEQTAQAYANAWFRQLNYFTEPAPSDSLWPQRGFSVLACPFLNGRDGLGGIPPDPITLSCFTNGGVGLGNLFQDRDHVLCPELFKGLYRLSANTFILIMEGVHYNLLRFLSYG